MTKAIEIKPGHEFYFKRSRDECYDKKLSGSITDYTKSID
jgi:hypothetical protein